MARCGWVALERGQGPAWVGAGGEGDASSTETMEMVALSRTLMVPGQRSLEGGWMGQAWARRDGQIPLAEVAVSHIPPYSTPRGRCQGASFSLER